MHNLGPGWWERLTLTGEAVQDLRDRAAARSATTFDSAFANFWGSAVAPEAHALFSSLSGELMRIRFICPIVGVNVDVDANLFGAEHVVLVFRARGRDWALGWACK
jgi:hypothetical protein